MTDILTHEERPTDIAGGEGHGLLTMPDGRSIPFKAHPLADLFPMMSADEMAALVDDVRERGVQRPIVMLDGMVLDGRNRYMAAREAGVGYRVVEFAGDDPVAFVVSENLRRRHLTDAQRAMVAAKLAKLDRRDTLIQNRSANLRNGLTTAAAAEQMSVSPRMVEAARTVLRDGAPQLAAAVETGDVAITAAAEVAKLPQAEQVEIVAKGPEAVKEAAAEARRAKTPSPKRSPASNLTPEALAEEHEALKEDLARTKAELEKVTRERDDLKARVADLSAENQGAVISKLQRQVEGLKYKLANAEDAAKRAEYKQKAAEKRVKELENLPIEMVS